MCFAIFKLFHILPCDFECSFPLILVILCIWLLLALNGAGKFSSSRKGKLLDFWGAKRPNWRKRCCLTLFYMGFFGVGNTWGRRMCSLSPTCLTTISMLWIRCKTIIWCPITHHKLSLWSRFVIYIFIGQTLLSGLWILFVIFDAVSRFCSPCKIGLIWTIAQTKNRSIVIKLISKLSLRGPSDAKMSFYMFNRNYIE